MWNEDEEAMVGLDEQPEDAQTSGPTRVHAKEESACEGSEHFFPVRQDEAYKDRAGHWKPGRTSN